MSNDTTSDSPPNGPITYQSVGVSNRSLDATKNQMAGHLEPSDPRVLNRLGAFASAFVADFPTVSDPVLILKAEEPGSKQVLAMAHGRISTIAQDTINHLVNDMMVMGAQPLAVLDTIVCGSLDQQKVVHLVAELADACRRNGCTLVGGETSIQPGVLATETWVITAAGLGVASRADLLDGTAISPGDQIVTLASNGPHTNGYTLIRRLLAENPSLSTLPVDEQPFIEAVLRPHTSYYDALRSAFATRALHGAAHITGGGIAANLRRILPSRCDAVFQLDKIKVPAVFQVIREQANLSNEEMLSTFNLGVGLVLVVADQELGKVIDAASTAGLDAYLSGYVIAGTGSVRLEGSIPWPINDSK